MTKSDDLNYQTYSEEEIQRMKENEIIIDRFGHSREVPTLAETIISKPPHTEGVSTFSEYIKQIKELSQIREADNLWHEEVEIKIDTPYKWFGVRPLSDLHIGHQGVDYNALTNILAGLLKNDNLATILLGDLGDFFVPSGKHPEGMLGDVVTPQAQLGALKKFFIEYQDKILAVTNDPHHEDWVYQISGIDTYDLISRGLDIPLVCQGGNIRLNVNNIKYDIIPFHNIARFRSAFNLTHGQKRALELHRDADVCIAGHIHKGALEKTIRNGHEVSLVQLGTLKVDDSWGKKMGFLGRPYIYFPIILFNTEEKRMQIIDNLEDAEDMLKIRK